MQVLPMVSFGGAVKSVFNQYATFSGRARRSEYWWFGLFNTLVCWVLLFVLGALAISTETPALVFLAYLWTLATFLPSLAVFVRRLHDVGKSGWWWLIAFIPLIGAIVLLVWLCTDSQPEANKYGPSPKYIA